MILPASRYHCDHSLLLFEEGDSGHLKMDIVLVIVKEFTHKMELLTYLDEELF